MDMLTTHLLSFLAGLVAGAGVLYWLLPARRQGSQLIRERDEARNALNHYRDQVDRHFLELSLIHISEPTRQAESRMPSSA